MPPVNQGSKAALITWTVVATVFGVTMAVLALIAYAGQNEAIAQLDTMQRSYNEIVSESEVAGARVNTLKQEMRQENRSGAVLNYLAVREENLANKSAGTTSYADAVSRADAALAALAAGGEDAINATSLTDAVDQLRGRVNALRQENQQLSQTNQRLEGELASLTRTTQEQLAAMQEELAGAQEQVQEMQNEVARVNESKADIERTAATQLEEMNEALTSVIQERDDTLAQQGSQLSRTQRDLGVLTKQRAEQFQGDQMLASADGRVIRSPTDGRLYINLGRADAVTSGMTFQVYDPVRGIPKAESQAELPKGKGSIQIIRVESANSSEARIVNLQPGQQIREGDLIANLAYDRKVPVRFRVYGDFDLNNDGTAEDVDRERVLTLIREFGGEIVDSITVQTNVLVMGQEPTIPSFTEEEMRDPIIVRRHSEAVRRREEYLNVQSQAMALNIPILNQNQFLYYIGYFDLVNR